ncbi:MAG: MFS transporter [Acidobacteriota bacterium]|nr:MFS transporter [Acidobacteriota bacterium]
MNAFYGWLLNATREQKRALLAASLGWMLDSMDVMLYALVLGPIQRDMHLSSAMSGVMMSATLVSAAVGGIAFGWFADAYGRTRALTWSVLIYSVGTALCGFAHSPSELLAYRTFLGLGMGGEWASGAALVAETWGGEHRAKALAVVQSAWAIGYALGAAIVAVVLPHFGWRAVFFAGILPALVTFWIRRSLHEPEEWQARRKTGRKHEITRPPLHSLFRGALGRNLLICSSMNAAALVAYWGIFTWVPRFLSMPIAQGGRGLNIVDTSAWTIVIQLGTFVGYIAFGYIASVFSHKRTYITYLLLAAAFVPLFAFLRSPIALLIVGPLVGFFGTGNFSGFSILSSELFPTSVRGSAMGFAYNIGRIVSAAAPWAIGAISQSAGLSVALAFTAAGFLLAALIAFALPRTGDAYA